MTKHVVILVDCSQSMVNIKDAVYESSLRILMNLQAKQPDVLISYAGFNSEYHHCFTREQAKYLSTIPESFASGGTQIYSAVCQMTNHLAKQNLRDDDMLFILMTDGEDNSDYFIPYAVQAFNDLQRTCKSFTPVLISLDSLEENIKTTAKHLNVQKYIWKQDANEVLKEFVDLVGNF